MVLDGYNFPPNIVMLMMRRKKTFVKTCLCITIWFCKIFVQSLVVHVYFHESSPGPLIVFSKFCPHCILNQTLHICILKAIDKGYKFFTQRLVICLLFNIPIQMYELNK